jgi:predicted ArsR family transcriptional regulator
MARNYVEVKERGNEIQALREAGKTRQAIADELGLTKVQIKNRINRHNKQLAAEAEGRLPRKKGRARTRPRTAEEEIKELRMENELLRDFLQLAGRR